MTINRWHRRIAITSVSFLALTAVTGILWAYAPHIYFREGYLKKKGAVVSVELTAADVTVAEVLATAAKHFKSAKWIESVSLRSEGLNLVYEVQKREGKEIKSLLIDAGSGKILSPLNEQLAIKFAAQYVAGYPSVKETEAIAEYPHRNGKKIKEVYRIAFKAPGNPEIYIDRNSGLIVEESDRSRAFHFWVMKLHQLQFFGTKKELTLIPGLGLILLIITGTWLWGRRLVSRFRSPASH